MANWYCTREQVKRAARINGSDQDSIIDRLIESEARRIDAETRRIFIPKTETRYYRYPDFNRPGSARLWLDQDCLAVTTFKTKAQDASPTTIAAADYFLEPVNTPPYNRIEIDLSSSSVFESGDTPQRSLSVLGRWGYSERTVTAGTLAAAISSATATTCTCSDGSLIDVGDALLIETEQIFVSGRANAASGTTLNGALTADKSEVSVPVVLGTSVLAGETILVDSERMYVQSITSNTLTVIRAYDGSTLAAHSSGVAVHVFRTLTIERAVNGTTGATHANATAISKYQPERDINSLNIAAVIAAYQQEQAGWGREVGGGEGAVEFSGRGVASLRKEVMMNYRKVLTGAI